MKESLFQSTRFHARQQRRRRERPSRNTHDGDVDSASTAASTSTRDKKDEHENPVERAYEAYARREDRPSVRFNDPLSSLVPVSSSTLLLERWRRRADERASERASTDASSPPPPFSCAYSSALPCETSLTRELFPRDSARAPRPSRSFQAYAAVLIPSSLHIISEKVITISKQRSTSQLFRLYLSILNAYRYFIIGFSATFNFTVTLNRLP